MSSNPQLLLDLMSNGYLYTLLKLFILLYASILAPQLPTKIAKLFHNSLFQVLLFGLITFVATKDMSIAILITIAFFISFHCYTRNIIMRLRKANKIIQTRLVPNKVKKIIKN